MNFSITILPEQVEIRGETHSYYDKQMAQESIRKILPLLRVVNSIRVAQNSLNHRLLASAS